MFFRKPQERKQILRRGMHAAVAEQSNKMKSRAVRFCLGKGRVQDLIFHKCTGCNSVLDPRDDRLCNTSRANTEMSELGPRGLFRRLADTLARSSQDRHRKFAADLVIIRSMGTSDGVALGSRAVAPAVQNYQCEWPFICMIHWLTFGNESVYQDRTGLDPKRKKRHNSIINKLCADWATKSRIRRASQSISNSPLEIFIGMPVFTTISFEPGRECPPRLQPCFGSQPTAVRPVMTVRRTRSLPQPSSRML